MLNLISVYDQKVLFWLNNLVSDWGFWNKLFSEYLIYLIPLVLIWLWFFGKNFSENQKVVLRVLATTVLSWFALARTVGVLVDRDRPFVGAGGVQELLFHRPDYSFPSDHATVMFAVAASFYFSGYKKLAYLLLVLAIVVSLFRVGTGLHWPSDIIVGAVFGIVCAWLIDLFDKPLNIAYEFILRIAKKLRLA